MKKKVLWIMNIALVLVAVLLALHFFEVELPSLGKAGYYFDKGEPVCAASFKEERSLLDLGSCCFGLQKQLKCENLKEPVFVKGLKVNKRCYTGGGAVEYLVNNKAYNYCKKEGYLSYRFI